MTNQRIGLPPRNKDTLDYTGRPIYVMPTFQAPRDPVGTDKNYPIQTIWRNSTNNNEWILVGFSAGLALWKMFTFGAGTGTVNSLTGNDAVVVGPNNITGNINVVGDGTTITITGNAGTNTLTASLVGGGLAIDTLTVQAATLPGVVNVTPDGSGVVTVNAAAVAAHSVPIETRSRALNAYNVEAQYASDVAATDATKSGLAHFRTAQFSVDGNGFVSLAGGSGPPIQTLTVDTFTAPALTNLVSPSSGTITITGAQVSTGTVGANVIRTDSKAAGAYTIEIQRSTMVGAADSTKNGVAHFDSADFSVDGNGFVSLNGTAIVIWATTSVNVSPMLVNHGYFCISPGGALVLQLPTAATTSTGDILEIVLDGATSFQIAQTNAAHQIQFGTLQTTLGATGTITSTAQGDTLRLVAQTSTRWNVLSNIGNFVVA